MTLPKAKLFSLERNRSGPRFARFRLANAVRVYLGPFTISWRMPWLERSARQLHPEHFE